MGKDEKEKNKGKDPNPDLVKAIKKKDEEIAGLKKSLAKAGVTVEEKKKKVPPYNGPKSHWFCIANTTYTDSHAETHSYKAGEIYAISPEVYTNCKNSFRKPKDIKQGKKKP